MRVSILGESVLVDGIEIYLAEDPSFQVQRIYMNNDDPLHSISEFKPDAIIFPLSLPRMDEVLKQIWVMPSVRLVGLDTDCSQVLIMDRWLLKLTSMTDLQRLLIMPVADFIECKTAGQLVDFNEQPVMEVDALGH